MINYTLSTQVLGGSVNSIMSEMSDHVTQIKYFKSSQYFFRKISQFIINDLSGGGNETH